MNHGFIGFGNLAKAVYKGLENDSNIQFGYFARNDKEVGIPFFTQIQDLVSFADVIWLAIKPQDIKAILEQLQPLNFTGKVIVSPVAGKSIAFIEKYLGKEMPIVRIMPNLAMAYQESVTAFTTNQPDNKKTEEIFHILSKLGKAVKLNESGFDLFTSVFGSGPAFILSFIQIFKDKMREFDLPAQFLMNYFSNSCRVQLPISLKTNKIIVLKNSLKILQVKEELLRRD